MATEKAPEKSGNKAIKYIFYALGEIVLVVIGILIALQINNNNEANKKRATELHYLENIKTDLNLTLNSLDDYIGRRTEQIATANIILEHYNGKPIEDYTAFNMQCVSIYSWQRYNLSDNTFQELVNSGNLALISNDSIKNNLLNLESKYKEMKDGEDHFRYDAEMLLYNPSYANIDMDLMVKSYMYRVTDGKLGENVKFNAGHFRKILDSFEHKNGMAMTVVEFSNMLGRFAEMKVMANELIRLIDNEMTKT